MRQAARDRVNDILDRAARNAGSQHQRAYAPADPRIIADLPGWTRSAFAGFEELIRHGN